jgi:hypothetical protein
MQDAKSEGLHVFFKVQPLVSMATMVLIDANGAIRTYNDVREILKEFFDIR